MMWMEGGGFRGLGGREGEDRYRRDGRCGFNGCS